MIKAAFLALFSAALLLRPVDARADDDSRASFALIIGSNASVDADLPALKYADDDAARYLDLFRLLGARTYLLTRLDDNTRRLHPQAAAEAMEPNRAALDQATVQLTSDVARARDRGVDTVLYVVYAGHGNVRNGEGYVTLEDTRITGRDLARLVAGIPATRVHVIVDACASYYLAYTRGPGGERRPLSGFVDSADLASDRRVGLLLSTSSARESHEWEGFEAGVFSHEVRSGLYGAADADGDGRVSYREIAAFISRANEAIPNERFRPNVHARPPQQSDTLLDLRHGLRRRLDIDGMHAGHYWIEDSRGVRLLDIHNGTDRTAHLLRPAPSGPVYVRRVADDAEFSIPLGADVVSLAELEARKPRVAARGAAYDAYGLLFSLPFDGHVVASYVEASAPSASEPFAVSSTGAGAIHGITALRRGLGWTALGLGIAGVGAGAALGISAAALAGDVSSRDAQLVVRERNDAIATRNTASTVSFVAGGATVAAGLFLLLWHRAPHLQATVSSSHFAIGYAVSY
ncbi:MAG: caspase family protein [Myxococcota bacterium]|nr:caspase family protein [Myxococcota bacterium]